MDELRRAALELRILITIVTRISSRMLEQQLHAHNLPISSLQYSILRIIGRQPYTIAELSRKLGLTAATLVPAVDALERHGLAARSHDPRDRRRTPLVPSVAGAALLERIPNVHDDDVMLVSLAAMPAEQRQQLLLLVRELLRGMPDGAVAVDEVATMIRSLAAQPGHTGAGDRVNIPDETKEAGDL